MADATANQLDFITKSQLPQPCAHLAPTLPCVTVTPYTALELA